jgi:hypothetical protein
MHEALKLRLNLVKAGAGEEKKGVGLEISKVTSGWSGED